MTNPFRLAGLAPLTHHLARPAMTDPKIKRNRLQTVRATIVRGQKLPPQIIIEGSRHSIRVARESLHEVYTIHENDLGALGLLELDLSLASPIVDLLLGGVGRVATVRDLTSIEEAIFTSVVEMIVRELNGAWQPVGLRFAFGKRETAAQVARMMPSGEKTMCVCFEVNMPEAHGVLNLCLPTVVLNAILRQLIADRERPRRRSEQAERRIRELMGEANFGAVLQFPPLRLRAQELAGIVPGTILRLPLPRHSAAELRVGGICLGKARPVRMGEHRGAQIQGERASDSLNALNIPTSPGN